jgi:hypothetical protein
MDKNGIKSSSRNGNMLFIILIAVMLFGALAYVLTRHWGGFSSISTQEQARLFATDTIQYANSLRPVIDKMLLIGGVSDTNTSGNGLLFAAAGAHADGKTSYLAPPAGACLGACAYEFSGQYTVTGVGSNSRPELAMLLINVTKDFCEKANQVLNLGWSSVPAGGTLTLTRFNGTNYGVNPVTLTGGANEFVGKRAFCYRESGGGQRYIYLHVLRGR